MSQILHSGQYIRVSLYIIYINYYYYIINILNQVLTKTCVWQVYMLLKIVYNLVKQDQMRIVNLCENVIR